jgi:hypothetical protein
MNLVENCTLELKVRLAAPQYASLKRFSHTIKVKGFRNVLVSL